MAFATVSLVAQIINTYIFISQFAKFMLFSIPLIEAIVGNSAFISKTEVTNECLTHYLFLIMLFREFTIKVN